LCGEDVSACVTDSFLSESKDAIGGGGIIAGTASQITISCWYLRICVIAAGDATSNLALTLNALLIDTG
jgi:hypothetical protein